jgi:hypothetical protein
MEVQAFAASRKAILEEAGGVTADGFPMTSCLVETIPTQITIPLVLAVHTRGGSDYDMHRFIIATSPDGQRVGLLEFGWGWPDEPGQPVKFRVFAQQLLVGVYSAGLHHIGLYADPNGEPEASFPLPVLRLNPLMGTPATN